MKEIKYIEVSKIYPHPDNPRKELGDLTELTESIKTNGIYQNLTVIPRDADTYTAIIGHRRLSAAKLAGLEVVPCIVTEMDEKTQFSTMLLENMQRSDLTVYEQAQGFQMMLDLGTPVAEISEKTGFAETTVRKRLKIAALPAQGVKEAEERGARLEDYVKICDIEDEKKREELLGALGTDNFKWKYNNALNAQKAAHNLPLALAEVKAITDQAGVTSDIYSSDYETAKHCLLEFYTPGGVTPTEIDPNAKYIYVIAHGRELYLLKKIAKKKKAAPKKSKKEIKADERRKELSRISTEAAKLRFDFVAEFTAHKKYAEIIAEYLVKFALQREISYIGGSRKIIKTVIGQTEDKYAIDEALLQKAMTEEPQKLAVATAYMVSGDDDREGYYFGNYGESMPQYQKNKQLDLIYEFLCAIGYQMSEEEKQLQSGTHELFEVKK